MDMATPPLFEQTPSLLSEMVGLRNACHLGRMDTAITTLFEQNSSVLSEMVGLRNACRL